MSAVQNVSLSHTLQYLPVYTVSHGAEYVMESTSSDEHTACLNCFFKLFISTHQSPHLSVEQLGTCLEISLEAHF
jgi:hypothetical protein